jgi:hypothetical protein
MVKTAKATNDSAIKVLIERSPIRHWHGIRRSVVKTTADVG